MVSVMGERCGEQAGGALRVSGRSSGLTGQFLLGLRQPLSGGVYSLGARQLKRDDLVQAAGDAAVWLLLADGQRIGGA